MDRPIRQHPRYAHEAAITLRTLDQEIAGRTRNLSRGGLCAVLCEPIAIGTEIVIDIQLVFEHGRHSEALRLPARIAWCTSINDSHQVGVQFLGLDSEASEYLTMFLRYLDDENSAKLPDAAASLDDRFR